MKLDSLEKLFVHELKDIHSAENQMLDALPKMEAAASDADLKAAFRDHREETQNHVSRIEEIFKTYDYQPGGHRCRAMAGLVEECADIISADADESVRDAGLIASAQRVEHYEIAAYGTAAAFAEKLGDKNAADLLRKTLEEEGKADRDLTTLAERVVNFKARVAAS